MNVPMGHNSPHESSAEHVMDRIAEQILGNTQEEADGTARLFASPLARRVAHDRGIDLSTVKGSGPHGRIVLADVERAAAQPEPASSPVESAPTETPVMGELMQAPTSAPTRASGLAEQMPDKQILALYEPGRYDVVPHDTMRRFIAERLTLAKQTIPHFYLNIECELDALLAARERLNGMAPQEGPRAFKLSVNDFIIKAMAMALQT
ncbi:MAG: E3 binding domain-containing protein, partial [Pseudomonadota bacterium]